MAKLNDLPVVEQEFEPAVMGFITYDGRIVKKADEPGVIARVRLDNPQSQATKQTLKMKEHLKEHPAPKPREFKTLEPIPAKTGPDGRPVPQAARDFLPKGSQLRPKRPMPVMA